MQTRNFVLSTSILSQLPQFPSTENKRESSSPWGQIFHTAYLHKRKLGREDPRDILCSCHRHCYKYAAYFRQSRLKLMSSVLCTMATKKNSKFQEAPHVSSQFPWKEFSKSSFLLISQQHFLALINGDYYQTCLLSCSFFMLDHLPRLEQMAAKIIFSDFPYSVERASQNIL